MELSRRAFGAALAAGALGASRVARAEVVRSERAILPDTRWETPCSMADSGLEGPTVLIVAGMHGNEIAPPKAAAEMAALSPKRGRIAVVPEVNRPALAKRTRHTPGARHTDLNRNFPGPQRPEARGELATALWALTESLSPDWVLDLHEGWGYSKTSKSMGSSIVHAPHPDGAHDIRPHAEKLVGTVNATIAESRKHFTIIGPGPAGSYARAVVEVLGARAFVFETTWVDPMDLRVSQHHLLVTTLLTELGVV